MRTETSWLKTRKILLQQLKLQVAQRLGPPSSEIRRYTARFDAEFTRGSWRPSSKKELLETMASADVVYAGDFHAFAQSQRMHLRLLRSLHTPRPVVLACEFLDARFQKTIDLYLRGRITTRSFLDKVQWHRWGFPWDHYGPLLHLARDRGWRVRGLNQSGVRATLRSRDRFAARQLAQVRRGNPGALVYVVFGELHMAQQHLPTEFRRTERSRPKEVFIYQDVEKIYFQLAKQNLESQLDVVRSGANRFCVLAAPPWVRWQSYEMYLEKTYDRDLDESAEPVELSDHVRTMVNLISQDLGVGTNTNTLAVYSGRDPQVLNRLKDNLAAADLKVAKQLMVTDRSFYLPEGDIFYLSRESVNHAAHLAGEYVHAFLSGRKVGTTWNMPKQFLALIWIEAVGFFASKMVNHKRAAETLLDLKLQYSDRAITEHRREILGIALQQRLRERVMVAGNRPPPFKLKPRRKMSYLDAALLLGTMMGEKLYQSYRHRSISTRTMVSYLSEDVMGAGFPQFYYKLVRQLESRVNTEKTRSERL